MDYNTQRNKMRIPEYGRNVHRMVEHCLTIEDREKRTQCAYAIVNVMSNLVPASKDVSDYEQKLWDHLAIMAEFKLDVDAPYTLPQEEILHKYIVRLPYPKSTIKVMHYGVNVENLIALACRTEDPAERMQMSLLAANHMKKAYLQWNKNVVNDEKIYNDLRLYSDGLLDYSSNDFRLVETKEVVPVPKKKKSANKTA
jgi:hypothetical protein